MLHHDFVTGTHAEEVYYDYLDRAGDLIRDIEDF